MVFHRRRALTEQTVFRMVDLETGGPGTRLAEAAHAVATLELLLLGGREVEEAQTEDAAAIAQAHQQAAPATLDDVAGRHLAFHHGLHAALERADGGDASPVLITQRQVGSSRSATRSSPSRDSFSLSAGPTPLRLSSGCASAPVAKTPALAGPEDEASVPALLMPVRGSGEAEPGMPFSLLWRARVEHSAIAWLITSIALGRGKLARHARATLRLGGGVLEGTCLEHAALVMAGTGGRVGQHGDTEA